MSVKKKWIELLYSIATGSRGVRNLFTPIGAFVFGLLVFACIIAAHYVDQLLGLPTLLPTPINILAACPVFLLAMVLIGWSVVFFLKAKGTPVPVNPPPTLVTTGPYAYTRNPMLTGVFSLLFGFGLYLGSASLLFVFTPLFMGINYWELKSIEEPELEKRLGIAYVKYRQKTPMFFPNIKSVFLSSR